MSEKRFTVDYDENVNRVIYFDMGEPLTFLEVVDLLNEYETVLNDTQTFALNLCKFIMEKGLDDEFREKYKDESLNFKMSNAVYKCGDGV